jgi:hypothetical protein
LRRRKRFVKLVVVDHINTSAHKWGLRCFFGIRRSLNNFPSTQNRHCAHKIRKINGRTQCVALAICFQFYFTWTTWRRKDNDCIYWHFIVYRRRGPSISKRIITITIYWIFAQIPCNIFFLAVFGLIQTVILGVETIWISDTEIFIK